jgi:uncharacterized protein YecE (DUF72 family)
MDIRLKLLKRKAGPVLFQLPPNFKEDNEKLTAFLKLLSKKRRYAFEFRDESWYRRETFEILRNHNVSLCVSDHHDAPSPWIATARHVYIRGHGPAGDYKGNYASSTLRKWAYDIRKWRRQGREVSVYFVATKRAPHPPMLFDSRRCSAAQRIRQVVPTIGKGSHPFRGVNCCVLIVALGTKLKCSRRLLYY